MGLRSRKGWRAGQSATTQLILIAGLSLMVGATAPVVSEKAGDAAARIWCSVPFFGLDRSVCREEPGTRVESEALPRRSELAVPASTVDFGGVSEYSDRASENAIDRGPASLAGTQYPGAGALEMVARNVEVESRGASASPFVLASDEGSSSTGGVISTFVGATLAQRLAVAGGVQLVEGPLPFGEALFLLALGVEAYRRAQDVSLADLVAQTRSVADTLLAWPALYPHVLAFEDNKGGDKWWEGWGGDGRKRIHCECRPTTEAFYAHQCPNVSGKFPVPSLKLCYPAALPGIIATKPACWSAYSPARCGETIDPGDAAAF